MQAVKQLPIDTFNGLIETAMRLLIILETNYGRAFDFETIRLMDFFAVFAGDIDGPKSLHPINSARGGAFIIRKTYVENALNFLVTAGLLSDEKGLYSANYPDDGDPYRTQYLRGIQSAAIWMKERIHQIGLKSFVNEARHTAMTLVEESFSALPPQGDKVFPALKSAYESDIQRLEGLQDACEVFKTLLETDFKTASNDNGSGIPSFAYFEAVHEKAVKEAASTSSSYAGLLRMQAEETTQPMASGLNTKLFNSGRSDQLTSHEGDQHALYSPGNEL